MRQCFIPVYCTFVQKYRGKLSSIYLYYHGHPFLLPYGINEKCSFRHLFLSLFHYSMILSYLCVLRTCVGSHIRWESENGCVSVLLFLFSFISLYKEYGGKVYKCTESMYKVLNNRYICRRKFCTSSVHGEKVLYRDLYNVRISKYLLSVQKCTDDFVRTLF